MSKALKRPDMIYATAAILALLTGLLGAYAYHAEKQDIAGGEHG